MFDSPFGSPLGSIRIFSSPFWPKVQKGTKEIRIAGHPIVQVLSRALARIGIAFDPDIRIEVPNMVDSDALFNERAGVLYCSEAQLAFWQAQFASRNSTV